MTIANKKKIHWGALLGFVLGSEIIGNIGSLATFSQITTWYATLNKPSFQPPNWLFGPVWTILFALMGISLYLIWSQRSAKTTAQVDAAVKIFALQFALNVLWSFLFFGFHEPYLAFIEICILWLAIVATIIQFKGISRTAAWLLLPYLAWVSFASVLNYAVSRLN